MSSAICWKNVDVVRPHPGHAVTCGSKLRRPRDWRICWATRTSSARSAPGRGVRDTLMGRAPVDADAYGLVAFRCNARDRAEVLVAALATDVTRVDAILVECSRAFRMLREKQVAVVMEVANDRDGRTAIANAADDLGNSCRGFVVVDRDADDLRSGGRQRAHLIRRRGGVGGVGVGHGLHDDREGRTNGH